MRHFFFVVYYCMVVAQGHSQPFNHTDGCHVFRSDTATDSFQFQLSKGVFQTRAGGFLQHIVPFKSIDYNVVAAPVTAAFAIAGMLVGAVGGFISIRKYLKKEGNEILGW